MKGKAHPKVEQWASDREDSFQAWATGMNLFEFKTKLNGGLIE